MELALGNISMCLHCNCRCSSEVSVLGLAAKDTTRKMQSLEGEIAFKKAGNNLSELTVLLGHMWLLQQPQLQELVPHRISRGAHPVNVQGASRQCLVTRFCVRYSYEKHAFRTNHPYGTLLL